MTLEEQIQEVSADLDEIKRVIDSITRPRIKQNLELQQRKFEKELLQLQEKQQTEQRKQLEQQQKAAALTKESQSNATTNSAGSRSYTKDISVYAWDQSDKFVKIYVQNLDGVNNLPESQVQCSFEKRGFHLQIENLKNTNYSLKRISLLHEIQPDQSTFKVKKDMIIVSLRKVDSKNWEYLLEDEKKAAPKPLPKLDKSKDSNESFLNMVEEMYETGDDDMKRAIAKAWVQSKEKANTLGAEPRETTNPGILRTADFTLYPPQ